MWAPAATSRETSTNNENHPRNENGGVSGDKKMDVASWWQKRELGFHSGRINTALGQAAEDSFVSKDTFQERLCDIPGTPRSTFLLVFSPDGTKVASTHGNHDVYVSELASGKHLKILSGHPRTPWCVTFHPSHTQVLASGCLGGQVRVWDLNGGSEVWQVKGTSVASIAFHPRDHLLVIAASSELYFWDWSHPQPFKCLKTNNIACKIRFVAFDSLGHKLITGISCWMPNSTSSNSVLELLPYLPSDSAGAVHLSNTLASVRDQMPPSYHSLIRRYDNLVRNYHRIIMSRSQSTAMIDRGTDPMETEWTSQGPALNLPQRTNSFTQTTNSLELRRNRLMQETALENSIYNIFNGPSTRTPDLQGSSSSGTNFGPGVQERYNVLDYHDENINYNILHEVTRNMPPISTQRQTSSSNRSMKAAYLNRLQNVLEIFIDQTLYSWERCETNCFLPSPALSSLRINTPGNSTNNSTPARGVNENNSSSDSNRPQTNSNPLQRDSVITFNRSARTERNQNNDGNVDSETRSLTNIQSMLRNSGDILINSIRTLRCFNTRLRMYRNRIRGNSDSQSERQISPNEGIDRIEDYLDHRNAYGPINTNLELPEQPTTSVESENVETTDTRTGALNVIHNRLRHSDDILMNSLTTLRNFKERLRVLQNEQTVEPVSGSSNPQSNDSNMGCTNDPPQIPDENVPQCSKNVTNEPNEKVANNINPDDNSQNNSLNMPSCSSASLEGPSTASQEPENDLNIPSTSGYRPNSNPVKSNRKTPKVTAMNIMDDAFKRVERGVNMIVRHNQELLRIWTHLLATRRDCSLSAVRSVWEGMRRDIMRLNFNPDQNEPSNCYSISLARLNALDGIFNYPPNTDIAAGQKKWFSNISKNKLPSFSKRNSSDKKIGKRRTKSASCILSQTLNSSIVNTNNPSTSQTNCASSSNANDPVPGSSSSTSTQPNPNELIDHEYSNPRPRARPLRRLLRPQSNRNVDLRSRLGTNYRRTELEITRDVIRLRARKIVSTMFGIMMYCLDSNQLHNQLVILVKTLKKALTVTCLLLMVNLFSSESHTQNLPARNNNVTQNSNSSQSNAVASDQRPNNIPNINVPNQTRNDANNSNNESNQSNTKQNERGSSSHLRQIRNRPSFYVRRRISLPSQNLPSSNSVNRPSTSRNSKPSTSRNQDVSSSENSASSNNLNSAPSTSNVPPQTQPPKTRPVQNSRSNLFRSHLSRPCFFRRLLCSQGFISETLRQANQPVQFPYNVGPESTGLRTLLSRLHSSSRRARTGTQNERSNSATNNVSVPVVQVNDVPIDMQNADPPPAFAARVFDQRPPEFQNILSMEDIIYDNRWTATIRFSSEPTQTFRIQAWDFTKEVLPDISDLNKNIVVRECKIHNDANIDISRDGRLLVALLLTHRIGSTLNVLGIFSLEWHNLGTCLFTTYMEQNAVSVSLSPCARHLAVGLGSKRVSLVPYGQNGIMAIIFRLDQSKEKIKNKIPSPRPLYPIRRLEHNFHDSGFTSMNCLKWAPQPGQGLVYANSIGQLKILS